MTARVESAQRQSLAWVADAEREQAEQIRLARRRGEEFVEKEQADATDEANRAFEKISREAEQRVGQARQEAEKCRGRAENAIEEANEALAKLKLGISQTRRPARHERWPLKRAARPERLSQEARQRAENAQRRAARADNMTKSAHKASAVVEASLPERPSRSSGSSGGLSAIGLHVPGRLARDGQLLSRGKTKWFAPTGEWFSQRVRRFDER